MAVMSSRGTTFAFAQNVDLYFRTFPKVQHSYEIPYWTEIPHYVRNDITATLEQAIMYNLAEQEQTRTNTKVLARRPKGKSTIKNNVYRCSCA